ncbi:MAG: hypothetical protein II013_07835 [Lachnobacterium sp.]|nr:hypothetical protein [Lachnobacterium sp.]
MIRKYKNKKFNVSNWIDKEYVVVDNEKHELWDYLQRNIENGNFYPDENTVECFNINGNLYTLDDILDRFNTSYTYFDPKCLEYPKQINGIIEDGCYIGLLIEVDEYGEKLRVWDEIKY